MADTSRQVQGGVQPFVVGDKSFRGIDTYTNPNKLENGFAETIDGLIVDGGSLVLRNGFHGQLPQTYIQTPSVTAGIYEMTPIKGQGSNAGHFIFTQGGEVYAFNTLSREQIALSTNFSATYGLYSPNVRMTTYGKYVYGVPGLKSDESQSTMPMFRVNTAQFMPITLSNSGGDLLITLTSPYNSYFVENGSPIRIRLVTGALPATVSPTVTYYTRDYVGGTSTSTFKISATLTGTRVLHAAATGTYQLVWMAEVLPTITGFPNLSPLARPNSFAQWALPPVKQNYFIDESVGPKLLADTGPLRGSNNLLISPNFMGTTQGTNIPGTPTATSGWGAVGSASVLVEDNGFIPGKNWYLTNNTNTITTASISAGATWQFVQIDGATDAIYQDIATTSGAYDLPREQINFVDQRQSATYFEGTMTAGGSVVTTTNPHGLTVGQMVRFMTGSTGITANTEAWVLTTPTNKTFTVSSVSPTGTALTNTPGGTVLWICIQPTSLYAFSFYALNLDDQNSKTGQSILAEVQASDASGILIQGAYVSQIIAPPIAKKNSDWVKFTVVADFRVYANTIGKIRVLLRNINAQQGSDKGIYVTGTSLYAISPRLGVDTADLLDAAGNLKVRAVQNNTNLTNVPYAGYIKGCCLKFSVGKQDVITFANGLPTITDTTNSLSYPTRTQVRMFSTGALATGFSPDTTYFVASAPTSNTFTLRSTEDGAGTISATGVGTGAHYAFISYNNDWSKYDTISVKMVFPDKLQAKIPQIRLGIQERNSTTTSYDYIEWAGFGNYDNENGYMTWSLRGLGKTRLDSIRQIYLRFETDVEEVNSGDVICYIGDVVTNGNLTAGSKYAYRYSLWYPKDGITAPFTPAVSSVNATVTFSGTSVTGTFTGTSSFPLNSAVQFTTSGALPSPLIQGNTYYVVSTTATTLTVATTIGGTAITFSGAGTGTHYISGVTTLNYLGFESEPTKVSGELTATEALSSNQIVLNPNGEVIVPGSQTYTHFIIYRRSTSFPDGLYRCIGSVPVGMNTTFGNNLTIKSTTDNKYVLIDNVPEMDVLDDGPKGSQGDIYESGQDLFPNGATVCTVHQSRLWIANKNTVWVSWFHNIDNEYTINTTHVPILTDPKVAIKGASFDVSSPYDTEYITGFLPYHGDMMVRASATSAVMLVFRENTVYPITGFDPSNWNIQGFLSESGIGLLAKRAAMTVMGQPWYVNSTGLVQFAGTKVIPASIQLDGIYSYKPYRVPDGTNVSYNTSIALSDYKKSFMIMHDKRVWLFGPSATYGSFTGQNKVRTAFVYDIRLQAWSTVSMPNVIGRYQAGVSGDITSGCSTPTDTDTESLYIGAANGQIYRYREYYDSEYELTTSSINATTNQALLTASDWSALNVSNGSSTTVIITSSTNPQAPVNSTFTAVLGTSGSNAFKLFPVGGGVEVDFVSTNNFSFRPVDVIHYIYNSRLYGQTYSEGVSYYSKNRPHQLDLHIETSTGGSLLTWAVFGAGATRDVTNAPNTGNSTMTPKQYHFFGNTTRAIRGFPTYMNDMNWQVILEGDEAFYPFRINGAHLHMVESGITRHR